MAEAAGPGGVAEEVDVRQGAGLQLDCRFSPALLQASTSTGSTLYWIRSNSRNHDNVAIGQTAFHQDYRLGDRADSLPSGLQVGNTSRRQRWARDIFSRHFVIRESDLNVARLPEEFSSCGVNAASIFNICVLSL